MRLSLHRSSRGHVQRRSPDKISGDISTASLSRLLPIIFGLLVFLGGCVGASQFRVVKAVADEPPADTTVAYSVFLIGDAGAARADMEEPSLRLLRIMLEEAGENAAVAFLGDNIYPSGLPPSSDQWREEAERRIQAQLEAVANFEGQILFVPGNHDWGGAGLGGSPATLRRQERYVEDWLDRGNVFVPDNGFPGPHEIRVNDWLTIVALDTQWFLEPDKQYGETGQYLLEQEGEVYIALHDILQRNRNRDIVVVAHHPIFTNGSHGGKYKGRRPIHVLTRRYLGTPQDLSNYRYRQMREGLLAVLERHPGLVYGAGHDHNLQYFSWEKQHFVISGSGTKVSYVDPGAPASFTMAEHGFSMIDYYSDGSTWLTFWVPEGDGSTGRRVYRTRLQEPGSEPVPERDVPGSAPLVLPTLADSESEEVTNEPVADSLLAQAEPSRDPAERLDPLEAESIPFAFHTQGTVTVAPGEQYQVGPIREFLLGERYRDLWAMPIEIPVIDLDKTAGGLTPIKRGGGLQTASLRLLGADGDEYVLRSVDKDPERSIPPYLRKTIVHDIVQDQISAMHPYAAFSLPPMLNAAGIYHTEPRLVSIPDDPRLGVYREEFAGMIAMFEMRPDEEQEDEARFGRPENIIGSIKLFENAEEDNDHRVDERAFARARIFDMWIGDWDRHKDQWRWSQFDVTPGKIYRPVPRDRDFAMFKFDGLLPRLIRWFGPLQMRRLTNFERGYHDVLGLNFNGAAMDRRFTSSLTQADWEVIADSLQATLTDSVIIAGLQRWPEPVYERYGEWALRLLQKRRDGLNHAAVKYYGHLAEIVDIVGSDKHERFEVRRIDGRETEIVMYKTKKEGDIDRELMRRTFHSDETDEVRLYGLGGLDQFVVTGTGRNRIRIRAIGGSGLDTFIDETRAPHTYFYDTEQGSVWNAGPRTEVVSSDDPSVNDYNMLRFEVDGLSVTPYLERNPDDGLRLGGGVAWTKQGFRKDPFASRHGLRASYAFRTGAYNVAYEGIVTDFSGPWDLETEASYLTPHVFDNFFGFGNNTPNNPLRRRLFASRLSQGTLAVGLAHEVIPFVTASFGPHFHYWNVEQPPNWQPPVDGIGLRPEQFTDTYFVGAQGGLTVEGRDSLAATRHGLFWDNRVEFNAGVRHASEMFARLETDLRYYYTFTRWPALTLAFRGGGATILGDFRFYQANVLGHDRNLRGFLRSRFSGRTSLFTNLDARVKLGDLNLYLTRGEFGVYGFLDNGRVWADEEDSDLLDIIDVIDWHQGYGGGIWFSPFYQLVVTTGIEHSSENTLFDLSIGFFF